MFYENKKPAPTSDWTRSDNRFRAPRSLVETLRTEAERRGVTSSDIGREALELFVCELAKGRQDAESEAA